MGKPTPTGPLYTAPVMVVGELNTGWVGQTGLEFVDANGVKIGAIDPAETAPRANPPTGAIATSEDYVVHDAAIGPVLRVAYDMQIQPQPKVELAVSYPDGSPVGLIAMGGRDGRLGYNFLVNGAPAGGFGRRKGLFAGKRYDVTDHQGQVLAEYDKRGALQKSFKDHFVHDKSYTMTRHRPLPEPLGSLVLAGALALVLAPSVGF